MRKQYSAPIIEKIAFDYKVQISTGSKCVESIMNIKTAASVCGEGTPTSFGWTLPQTTVNP